MSLPSSKCGAKARYVNRASDEATRRAVRLLELGALAGFVLAASMRAGYLLAAAPSVALLAGAGAGLIAADLLSGLVHWVGDTCGEPDSPILGPALIAPFREHHGDPLSIVRHDVFETNGTSALGALLPLLASVACPLDSPLGAFFACAFFWLSLWLAATNQIHKWAHAPRVPRLVAALQRSGLILDPGRHAVHHTAPFDRHYCITSGWTNPLVDRLLGGGGAAHRRA